MSIRATGRRPALSIAVLIALTLVAAPFAAAQGVSGNIYGKVVDDSGAPLPGVTVTLSGIGANSTAITGPSGDFRFINRDPGTYALMTSLAGFTSVTRKGIVVGSKQNTELTISMKIAARAESIEVRSESPLLDTRKTTQGTNVTKVELESIPSARDPWVVLQSVPGVQTDRVNVGGSESGQQSNYVGKGTNVAQNAWNMDGVVITDMAALGSSPSYYNFDSFEEMQVATGGTDPSAQTPGVQLNMVTKRGTNDLHGTARILITDQHWQAENLSDELLTQLSQPGATKASGNSVSGVQDYGADVGGPLATDKVWLWGAYGRNQIDLFTAGGLSDKTTLENINLKLNAQPLTSNSITAFYNRGDKIKIGRDAGATRPQETSWDQRGPSSLFKLEDSHIFSENLFVTAAGSYYDAGFSLIPEGSGPQVYQDSSQVYHNSYQPNIYNRPQTQLNANGSYFFRTGQMGHELKLGGVYRYNKTETNTWWPGGVVACATGANFCGAQTVPAAALNRDNVQRTYLYQYSGYLSDTITIPRLTANIGLRYDYQYGANAALQLPAPRAAGLVPAGTVLPPALSIPEVDPGFRWKDFQPRIGLTYAIGNDQKTLARASYARYADQLGTSTIQTYSVNPGTAGIYYAWNDRNNNRLVDSGELDTSRNLGFYNFNPANPTNVSSSINGVDPDFKAVKTDEFVLGFDREILPTFAVSLVGTYRKLTDFSIAHGFGLTKDNYVLSTTNYRVNNIASNPLCPQIGYVCGTLPDGTAFNQPVYRAAPGTVLSPGRYTENNPDYYERYIGLEFQATKRYANNWMARFSFSYNDWTQHYGANGYVDPTNVGILDGGLVAQASAGSGDKTKVYLNAKWQMNLSAMYSLPLGFSISGNIFARQGYPLAYFENVRANATAGVPSYDTTKSIRVVGYDDYRYPTVGDIDLGLGKVLKVGNLEMRLSLDVFNLLNSNTVFQRQNQIGLTSTLNGTNTIREQMAPRIARFGARVSF